MNSGKYVFAQVLSLVNRYEFQKCVKRYNGDYRTRELNCWNQFVQLFFGQLTGRKGLRDICLCLNAHKNNLYHLGIKQSVNQSSLSRANENETGVPPFPSETANPNTANIPPPTIPPIPIEIAPINPIFLLMMLWF